MQEIRCLSHLTWPNRGAKWTPGSVEPQEAGRDEGERRSRDCRHARVAANEYGGPKTRVDTAVVTLAGLMGRRIECGGWC